MAAAAEEEKVAPRNNGYPAMPIPAPPTTVASRVAVAEDVHKAAPMSSAAAAIVIVHHHHRSVFPKLSLM